MCLFIWLHIVRNDINCHTQCASMYRPIKAHGLICNQCLIKCMLTEIHENMQHATEGGWDEERKERARKGKRTRVQIDFDVYADRTQYHYFDYIIWCDKYDNRVSILSPYTYSMQLFVHFFVFSLSLLLSSLLFCLYCQLIAQQFAEIFSSCVHFSAENRFH